MRKIAGYYVLLSCLFLGLLALFADGLPAQNGLAVRDAETLDSKPGFATPEEAAVEFVRAIVTKDHQRFAQSRLLGVCEGPNGWPTRYARALHFTQFVAGGESSTVFDLERHFQPDTIRPDGMNDIEVVVGYRVSQHYASHFKTVDVVVTDDRDIDFRTIVVVGENGGAWLAVPRRTKSHGIYASLD